MSVHIWMYFRDYLSIYFVLDVCTLTRGVTPVTFITYVLIL